MMMFRKKAPSLEVIIGSESSIKGDIVTKGVIRIDGDVSGDIDADWLIVGKKGIVKGNVVSRGVLIDGRLEGNIKSNEVVEIKSEGIIEGDISTTRLIMSEGAVFDGHSYMKKATNLDNKDVLYFEQKLKKLL
jgi:cytoskeletal protein CcmA (bactofilin family)